MRPVALSRVAGLAPVVAFLRRVGAPVGQLLTRAGLPPFVLDHPERLIPVRQAFRFLDDAARAQGIANLGLLAGQEAQMPALGMFGQLIDRALTVREALDTVIRATPAFSSGGRYWLAYRGERVRLCHTFVDGVDVGYREAEQYCLMLALNILRLAAEPRWKPRDVRLETRTADGHGDGRILPDATIVFERDETALTFPRALLDRPLVRTCTARWIADEDVEAWMRSAPANTFVASLRQVIEALSSPDYPRVALVAGALDMSVRALQRRLAAVGQTYERLILRARLGAALRLLEETDSTVLDIALDLGYSDHAHFTRAFRQWTGMAPRDFRRVSRSMADDSLFVNDDHARLTPVAALARHCS